jgi:uncharacterized protein with HEPN domain
MTKVPEIAWLKDIIKAIEKIENHPLYLSGRAGYDGDAYYRDVVQLNIERICEAEKHLCDEHDYHAKYTDIPWRAIIGTRIIIAHHYWEIEDEIIWNIVERHLPVLKRQVQGWLNRNF